MVEAAVWTRAEGDVSFSSGRSSAVGVFALCAFVFYSALLCLFPPDINSIVFCLSLLYSFLLESLVFFILLFVVKVEVQV